MTSYASTLEYIQLSLSSELETTGPTDGSVSAEISVPVYGASWASPVVSVDGHVAVVVPPAGASYGAAGISIDGDKTIVTPLVSGASYAAPGVSVEQYSGKISVPVAGAIYGTPGIWAGVAEAILQPGDSGATFAGPGITVDGHKTIVPTPASGTTWAATGIFVVLADQPTASSGNAVFPPAAGVSFGSWVSVGVFDAVGSIESHFPQMAFRADAFTPTSDIEAQLPPISFDAYTGEHLSTSLPLFEMEGELSPGSTANLGIETPAFRMEAFCGDQIIATIPFFKIEMEESYNHPADVLASMPSLTMLSEASSEKLASLVSSIPAIRLDLDSKSNNGDINCILPSPDFSASFLLGGTSSFNGEMPSFMIKIQSVATGDNDLVATFCSPQLYMQAGELDSDVLRYIKRKIR